MRHILISFVLLALVFAGGMAVQHRTEVICQDIAAAADRVLQTAPEHCQTALDETIHLCTDKTEFLALFHHHSLTETLVTNLRRAAVYAADGNYTEMRSELQAAKSTLATLARRDTLTIDNIF